MKDEGVAAVTDFFNTARFKDDKQKIAKYVADFGGTSNPQFHFKVRTKVGLFSICNTEPPDLVFKRAKDGVLQSPLIKRALSAYYGQIAGLPDDAEGVDEIPYTAIVYAAASVGTSALS